MLRSWLIKILLCFSHTNRKRRKQQSAYNSIIENEGKCRAVLSCSCIPHTFSPPLKVSMLRKVRCRIQPRTFDNNLVRLPLLIGSLKQQPIAGQSQNCAEIVPYKYTSSTTRCKQNPSLIAIDIGDDGEYSRDGKQSTNFYSRKYSRSLIKLTDSDSSLAISSYCSHPHKYLSLSVRKQISDSIIFVHRYRPTTNRQHYVNSKQRSFSDYSPHNTNSITYDSPLSDTIINTTSSNSDVFTPINRTKDKTWRLQIHDDLNKDGSRHNVMHKGSEESIRKNRQNKRAKRSEEKKRKIEEKIQQANQRWQKYSNIDYELVLFISRYYDQLPLCSNCRNYFVTHQTQILAEDPRASLDYAADAVLHSPNHKTMTMKQAAKARLIQDYDKQSDILFNLCDTCLTKCEQIRNELKQINLAQKIFNESNSPNINMTFQQQPIVSPALSPNVSDVYDHSSSPIPPSPLDTNLIDQQKMTSTSPQTTITDLNQIYINNLIQNHQINLQQLYQQSQNIILTQQYYPFANNQQQLHYDLQSCIKQMQYHCLEILHLQYPNCSLSFPYTPSSHPQHLSYRYQQIDDESTDSESSSSLSDEDESDTSNDDNRCSPTECDENQQSMDDRLTIETCHGLVEYCNAPLDDFIRGLQVLKCLSNFNCYSTCLRCISTIQTPKQSHTRAFQ